MQQSNAAFESMYQEYKTLVFNMALHYLQNREDAEEVTQDVFVKVYHSLHTFNHQSSPKTWLYRITINQCLDVVKKKNSRKRFYIFGSKSQDEKEYLNATTLEHPGILMEHREDAQILFDAINTLTENQKTAFLLSKVEGLPNPEIAAVMEVSISSVESLVFRAKASLQEKLGEKFETYRKKKK